MSELLATISTLLTLLGQLLLGTPEVSVVTPTTRADFMPLYPMSIGSTTLDASVADTFEERAAGLSHTTELPTGIAKVFVFDYDDRWAFWMKDMTYAIDMVWVSASGTVVHIAPAVTPASYPTSFAPAVPARYVVEVPAGFMAGEGYGVGTPVRLPDVQSE